jgi:hypothetical protein
MEQTTLLQIARLRTIAARKGKPFDVVRFATDREFSKATLKALLDTDDEDLLLAGLKTMDAMNMTSGATRPTALAPTPPAGAVTPEPAARGVDPKKYVGGLR